MGLDCAELMVDSRQIHTMSWFLGNCIQLMYPISFCRTKMNLYLRCFNCELRCRSDITGAKGSLMRFFKWIVFNDRYDNDELSLIKCQRIVLWLISIVRSLSLLRLGRIFSTANIACFKGICSVNWKSNSLLFIRELNAESKHKIHGKYRKIHGDKRYFFDIPMIQKLAIQGKSRLLYNLENYTFKLTWNSRNS